MPGDAAEDLTSSASNPRMMITGEGNVLPASLPSSAYSSDRSLLSFVQTFLPALAVGSEQYRRLLDEINAPSSSTSSTISTASAPSRISSKVLLCVLQHQLMKDMFDKARSEGCVIDVEDDKKRNALFIDFDTVREGLVSSPSLTPSASASSPTNGVVTMVPAPTTIKADDDESSNDEASRDEGMGEEKKEEEGEENDALGVVTASSSDEVTLLAASPVDALVVPAGDGASIAGGVQGSCAIKVMREGVAMFLSARVYNQLEVWRSRRMRR